eukprot:GHVP01053764.1.p1 GENE.GHVP01053764.1~~GHVP01053764.1.p1  ORF type:complete len:315 (+),score=53.87 GHVP01053764.1:74-946(+)
MPLDKKKGQHLLKNPGILDKIIQSAGLRQTDTVLEIGPGTGNLTMRLLPLVTKVIAFDIDPRMVNEVKKRSLNQGYMNLEVRVGDALKSDFGNFHVCTANLPYQISSPFVFKLLSHPNRWRCAVLMFQREFAERLVAQPGEGYYCRLTVNTQLFCNVSRVCKVAPGSFNPPPKVESMVVRMTPKEEKNEVDFKEWDGMIRICFGRKNRMMRANFHTTFVLKQLQENMENQVELDVVKQKVMGVLDSFELLDKRATSIPVETFLKLFAAFREARIRFLNFNEFSDDDKILE